MNAMLNIVKTNLFHASPHYCILPQDKRKVYPSKSIPCKLFDKQTVFSVAVAWEKHHVIPIICSSTLKGVFPMKKKKILRQFICLAMATAMMLSFVLSASAYSTVKSGSKGSDVKTLQTMLNKVCNSGLTVDGIFGTNTKKAVVAYQSSKG
jgi:CRISPR/Cas system CMR subunit Cmr6 (Cas7 group RAMP superfamily)